MIFDFVTFILLGSSKVSAVTFISHKHVASELLSFFQNLTMFLLNWTWWHLFDTNVFLLDSTWWHLFRTSRFVLNSALWCLFQRDIFLLNLVASVWHKHVSSDGICLTQTCFFWRHLFDINMFLLNCLVTFILHKHFLCTLLSGIYFTQTSFFWAHPSGI